MRSALFLAVGILAVLSGCLHAGSTGAVDDDSVSATLTAEYRISMTGVQNVTRSVTVTEGRVRTVSDNPAAGEARLRYRSASIDERFLQCSPDRCGVVERPFPAPRPPALFTGALADAVDWRSTGHATVAGVRCQRLRATAHPVTERLADQVTAASGFDRYDTMNLSACVTSTDMMARFSAQATDRYLEPLTITAVLRSTSQSVERPLTPPVPAATSLDCRRNTGNITVFTSPDDVAVRIVDVTSGGARSVENLTVSSTAPWQPTEFSPETSLSPGNVGIPVIDGTPIERGSAACRGTRRLLSTGPD